MSSRRGAGEDNILAMLEREGARRTGTRMAGMRLAWYGAGAALCGILVGGVAWLAYDNGQAGNPAPAGYLSSGAATRAMDAPRADAAAPGAGALAAVVVDEQPRMRTAPPPLVMLPPNDAPASAPAAAAPPSDTRATGAAGTATARAAADAAAPPSEARRLIAGRPEERVRRPARTRAAEPKPSARRPAPTRAAAGAAHAASRATATPARKAGAPATATPVDGDVALISAIIAQSERHRNERQEAASCTGSTCAPKPARP